MCNIITIIIAKALTWSIQIILLVFAAIVYCILNIFIFVCAVSNTDISAASNTL